MSLSVWLFIGLFLPLVAPQVLETCSWSPQNGETGITYDLRPLANTVLRGQGLLEDFYYTLRICETSKAPCIGSSRTGDTPNDGMILEYDRSAAAVAVADPGVLAECRAIVARWNAVPEYSYINSTRHARGFVMKLATGDRCPDAGSNKRRSIEIVWECDHNLDPARDNSKTYNVEKTSECDYRVVVPSRFGCPGRFCGAKASPDVCRERNRETCQESGSPEKCGACLFGYEPASGSSSPYTPANTQCVHRTASVPTGLVLLLGLILLLLSGLGAAVAFCAGMKRGQKSTGLLSTSTGPHAPLPGAGAGASAGAYSRVGGSRGGTLTAGSEIGDQAL